MKTVGSFMEPLTAQDRREDRLIQENRELKQALKLEKGEVSAVKYSIVDELGGVDYEGFPTSELNYLQRIRILLEKEKELTKLQTENKLLAERTWDVQDYERIKDERNRYYAALKVIADQWTPKQQAAMDRWKNCGTEAFEDVEFVDACAIKGICQGALAALNPPDTKL